MCGREELSMCLPSLTNGRGTRVAGKKSRVAGKKSRVVGKMLRLVGKCCGS